MRVHRAHNMIARGEIADAEYATATCFNDSYVLAWSLAASPVSARIRGPQENFLALYTQQHRFEIYEIT